MFDRVDFAYLIGLISGFTIGYGQTNYIYGIERMGIYYFICIFIGLIILKITKYRSKKRKEKRNG